MARQNRVTPTGEIVAIPLRGSWMGNRGILHDEASAAGGRVVRHHAGDRWITCALSFRGWRAPQWQPHHYTPLFFHDEAVALAAGHRPCALCRRAAFDAYRTGVAGDRGRAGLPANEIDRQLHAERWSAGRPERTARLHDRAWPEVPAGAFVVVTDVPHLVRDDALVPWTLSGYGEPVARPRRGRAAVVTPPTSVAALRGGYAVHVDGSARR